ncbi:MAG: hypothetical protein OEN23_14385 [Paracoccaceae bacterium]|nr:hypothetical protein [Paracoccaceae bacterium]
MLDVVELAREQREELLRKIEEVDTILLPEAFAKDLQTKSLAEIAADWLPGHEQLSSANVVCLPQPKEASLHDAIRRVYKPQQTDAAKDERTVVARMTQRAEELAAAGRSRSLFRGAFLNTSDIQVAAA